MRKAMGTVASGPWATMLEPFGIVRAPNPKDRRELIDVAPPEVMVPNAPAPAKAAKPKAAAKKEEEEAAEEEEAEAEAETKVEKKEVEKAEEEVETEEETVTAETKEPEKKADTKADKKVAKKTVKEREDTAPLGREAKLKYEGEVMKAKGPPSAGDGNGAAL